MAKIARKILTNLIVRDKREDITKGMTSRYVGVRFSYIANGKSIDAWINLRSVNKSGGDGIIYCKNVELSFHFDMYG